LCKKDLNQIDKLHRFLGLLKQKVKRFYSGKIRMEERRTKIPTKQK